MASRGCALDYLFHNNNGSNGYAQDKRTDALFEASCHCPHWRVNKIRDDKQKGDEIKFEKYPHHFG